MAAVPQGVTPEWADTNCHAILEASPDAMLVVNRAGKIVAANMQAEKLYGLRRGQLIGMVVELLLPVRFRERHRQYRESFLANPENQFMQVPEIVALRSDASEFPVDVSLSRLTIGSETFAVSAIRDTTERVRVEELKRSRKLIEAQEQERARLGRELHDDINQRLAMLALELEQLQDNPSEFQSQLQDLRKGMAELSNDVQALSHELHSSKLEYLGVVAGIRSWCKESGERQKIEIEFRSDVSSTLPFNIGLCLFRVLQEAAHNAIKHSGVKRIEVLLREDSGEIQLIVSDSGRGFDVEAAMQGRGLGLTSMQERVRLVNGTIAIDAKPMGGTTIHVRVPFGSEQSARTGPRIRPRQG